MVKRKAEQGSEVGAEAKSAELGDMPAEVLTPQEQTVQSTRNESQPMTGREVRPTWFPKGLKVATGTRCRPTQLGQTG